ncbi:MAG TPA: response regulator [Candidatus Acidoferrales bacterium]|nr:response regulator [Candidatus Acidoferrales bacterium]
MNPPNQNAAPNQNATNGKILVIDDNPVIQRAMHVALQQHGYLVLESGDIAGALKIVREQRPDVILLDLNFPADNALVSYSLRDGFAVLEWLHRLEESKGIPIIVVSIDPPEKSETQALAAGAAAYFCKPVDNDELAVTLAVLLDRKGR